MTVTSRDKKLLALLALVGMIAACWFFAVKPMRGEMSKLDSKIEKEQDEVKAAEQQVTIFSAAQTSYASDYSTVVRLGVAVPDDDAVPSLLVQLDSITGKNVDFTLIEVASYPEPLLAPSMIPAATEALGIPSSDGAISALTDKASTDDGAAPVPGGQSSALPFQPVEMSLQFQGNFFKLHRLLSDIDRLVRVSKSGQIVVSGRMLFIEGFNIKAGRKGFPDVAFSISALAFSMPENESITGGATPQAPSQGGPQQVSTNGEKPSPSTSNASSGK